MVILSTEEKLAIFVILVSAPVSTFFGLMTLLDVTVSIVFVTHFEKHELLVRTRRENTCSGKACYSPSFVGKSKYFAQTGSK
jgi:hypothetical protein